MEKITLTIKDTNKLHFLKELLSQFDFVELEKKRISKKSNLNKFAGIWSKKEADKMKADISEACEQIHEEDW